ncbi:hypothetical protein [Crossiella cryophila]|uniref:Uncharacterized protein n=1 Tax=Crossiella cryophila TaxID=43355 RepID=A0A7W7FWV5_9PSEU|nr:hypothetical protein [Crossiella cryophila]MBB4678309.1 hypothetical protein [Crossiella cryophila]
MRSKETIRSVGTVLAAVALTAGLTGTAVAAPADAPCTWQVTPVAGPPGIPASEFTVTGSNAQGGYSGYRRANVDDAEFFRWVNGFAVRQPAAPGVTGAQPVDENNGGTVVLRGKDAQGERVLLTHSPADGYRVLPLPAGAKLQESAAVNDGGDVVAAIWQNGKDFVLLWRAGASTPEVITPPGTGVPILVDIDEDGTVLLSGGRSNVHVWRAGVFTAMPGSTDAMARSLNNGRVVGLRFNGQNPITAWQWELSTGVVSQPLRGGAANGINRLNLIGGQLDNLDGPPAVWRGTRLLAELPLPPGATGGRVNVVGDDGVVHGKASTQPSIPVRWHCS